MPQKFKTHFVFFVRLQRGLHSIYKTFRNAKGKTEMVKVEYRKINEQTTYTAQNDVSYRIVIKIIERIVILPIRSSYCGKSITYYLKFIKFVELKRYYQLMKLCYTFTEEQKLFLLLKSSKLTIPTFNQHQKGLSQISLYNKKLYERLYNMVRMK